ncbi:solute carrier family 41 member 3 isoform X3 [Monodelphis domestica]|uniref:solute carrier family 41 member 3 isoform X3 n=1 Tax=Monodelphis domestica TaxID=13616 RepID=UPI0024E1AFBA|nr:solute carrier family 41 member 3 isoform X3 [Monodelphis domestica]XP_056660700.1 solute carrier family 41 member 3 isoform X3 [Monodelphis domestica]
MMRGEEARQRRKEGQLGSEKQLQSRGESPGHPSTQDVPWTSQKRYPFETETSLEETALTIFLQALLPFVLAGVGMTVAGMFLDFVKHWKVFVDIKELLTLVPSLVGLKGNLEMTLASRFSTAVQATVVGLLAALVALVLEFISGQKVELSHIGVLCASSVVTAFVAAFFLGVTMIGVILTARKLGINPDNIATPIAAMLGDVIALSILALISSIFYKYIEKYYIFLGICLFFFALIPMWIIIVNQSPSIFQVLKTGWYPIIISMFISSLGGLIFSKAVSEKDFKGMAFFTPVVNGVGGNLVSIQVSRISTYLYSWSTLGVLPYNMKSYWPNPCTTFCSSEINSVSARVLLLLVVPGQLIFLFIIHLKEGDEIGLNPLFVVMYLIGSFTQVLILLYLADFMVRLIWRWSQDPDSYCIPYLTGLGDLLGVSFLTICFLLNSFLFKKNLENSNMADTGPP